MLSVGLVGKKYFYLFCRVFNGQWHCSVVVFKVVLLSRIILSFQVRLDQKAVSSVGVIADATSKVNICLLSVSLF